MEKTIDQEKAKMVFGDVKQCHVKEWNRYSKEEEIEVQDWDVQKIVNKITRHFKLGNHSVKFRKTHTSHISKWGREIVFWHHPSFRIVCHELCHTLCWKKYPSKKIRHGTKKWQTQMKRLINYGRKKNFWKDEIEKWRQPKPQKPEPTKQEIRLQKINRLEQSIKRHQTKIKRCQTLIKKAHRRITGLKRFL